MSDDIDHTDEATLRRLYYEKELSTGEIAERADVSPNTIAYWMGKHDLDRRMPNETHGVLEHEYVVGEEHTNAKLTRQEVRSIRNLYDLGLTTVQLADKYGVSDVTVGRIVNGVTWRHVDHPLKGDTADSEGSEG